MRGTAISPHRPGAVVVSAGLLAIALAACHARPGGHPAPSTMTAGRETVVTAEEIAKLNVRTAWDVVRLRAPRIRYGTDQTGRPTGVMIQPRGSVKADETPILILNGMRVGDLMYLDQIPASDVKVMRILDGSAAEPIYGLEAAGGAVVVETKTGN